MDAVRKLVALLVAIRALTNFGKPFSPGSAFVVFGRLMRGMASTVVAPLFGVGMLVYAYGLWQARPWALPVGIAYAVWATANVVLFPLIEGVPAQFAPWMYALFAIPGVVGPWLAVWLLIRARS
jgi:hypothetical protein